MSPGVSRSNREHERNAEGEQRAGRCESVSDERGRAVRADASDRGGARRPARARGEVSVALVSDRRVRALTGSYRRTDFATDVLSFPATSARHRGHGGHGEKNRSFPLCPPRPPWWMALGDI